MRSPWFVAAVLVALAAAGWALHTLSAGEDDRSGEGVETRRSPKRETSGRTEDAAAARRTSPRMRESASTDTSGEATLATDTADIEPAGSADRPAPGETPARGEPPPRIEPQVDLEQARADFQAVLEELEAHAAADHHLDNAAWVELYKRGNEALVPLQQHLDWKVPEEAEELRGAQTKLREKLHAVAPEPVLPP